LYDGKLSLHIDVFKGRFHEVTRLQKAGGVITHIFKVENEEERLRRVRQIIARHLIKGYTDDASYIHHHIYKDTQTTADS